MKRKFFRYLFLIPYQYDMIRIIILKILFVKALLRAMKQYLLLEADIKQELSLTSARRMDMVYGAINENGESYYTQMGRVFDAISNKQMEYNWLITDLADGAPPKIWEHYNDDNYCWITGEQLSEIVREQDVQWVWAVLSGFEKNISLPEILLHPLPYADGYGGFWSNPVTIQHPLATVEIVPWDSSLTLCISKNKDLVKDFLSFFPLSEDLSIYNERFK